MTVKTSCIDSGVKAQAGAHRFQGVVECIETVLVRPAHQRGDREIRKSQLRIRIQYASGADVSTYGYRRTVEIRASQNRYAVIQLLAMNILGPGKGSVRSGNTCRTPGHRSSPSPRG